MTGAASSPVLTGPSVRDDATRRAELAVMKRVATGMLAVALVVYGASRWLEPRYPWMGFVRATAEASLIGGLADWFAVTALFRKPLGLPIPHTAIIQTQKDRIGRILGNFVQNHFLSRDVLAAKLHSMKLADRTARWIRDPMNSERLAGHLAVGVAQAVQALPASDASGLIRETAVARLHSVQLAPVLGKLLSAVAADDRHQALLDEALKLMGDAIEANRDLLRQRIKDESPWWVPGPVDDALHRRIVATARALIDQVKADPSHPLRRRFDTAFRDFLDRLEHSPEVIARTEALKNELLDHPVVDEFASSLWDRARQAAARYSAGAAGGVPGGSVQPLARGISALGESLLENDARLTELDDFLVSFIAAVLEQHRHEVVDLIAKTIERWDPEVAAERIELAVGRDLQFIRLNGTLVGGLAGLIIYTLSFLFG